ncbi:hypothetical protein [Ruegeria atlantica]|uniref:hypothetical protein n=1 Tax=Ruegeria atlantica TaxID=81569 RepID=UPI00147C2106|nr:hypothetical protein [Ruegeria atlantica]
MMALIGGSLFLLFLSRDLPQGLQDDWAKENLGLVVRYVIAMTLGGAIMGYLLASMFGRNGFGGWVLALLGGLISTLVAGACGSLLGLLPDILDDGWQASDLVSILFGFLVLPIAAVDKLGSSAIWLAAIAVTHMMSKYDRARNAYRS